MFCLNKTDNMINKLHERTLKNDQNSNSKRFLVESSDICDYHINIQSLMTEDIHNYGL